MAMNGKRKNEDDASSTRKRPKNNFTNEIKGRQPQNENSINDTEYYYQIPLIDKNGNIYFDDNEGNSSKSNYLTKRDDNSNVDDLQPKNCNLKIESESYDDLMLPPSTNLKHHNCGPHHSLLNPRHVKPSTLPLLFTDANHGFNFRLNVDNNVTKKPYNWSSDSGVNSNDGSSQESALYNAINLRFKVVCNRMISRTFGPEYI